MGQMKPFGVAESCVSVCVRSGSGECRRVPESVRVSPVRDLIRNLVLGLVSSPIRKPIRSPIRSLIAVMALDGVRNFRSKPGTLEG
ncbi:hypothetical protein B0G76_0084 [Paraburkholderia sp. BL23I1N1]|nr:hypothetical protein B0G76_0084 [Paraburkholderia sp. BL23I1N1]